MPGRTARRRSGTRRRRGRPRSGHVQELERRVGHEAAGGQPAEEVRQTGEVLLAKGIVEPGEIAAAVGHRDACRARGRIREQIEVSEAPVADASKARCTPWTAWRGAARRAAHTANTN